MSLTDAKIFNSKYVRVIQQLEHCLEWSRQYDIDREAGWDVVYPFEMIRSNTLQLIYLFSDLFKAYANSEQGKALDEDLKKFSEFLLSADLARALNSPEDKKGDISTAISQIRMFFNYVRVVLEETKRDIEEEVNRKFVEHCLRNAGLVPSFEKLKKVEEKAKPL